MKHGHKNAHRQTIKHSHKSYYKGHHGRLQRQFDEMPLAKLASLGFLLLVDLMGEGKNKFDAQYDLNHLNEMIIDPEHDIEGIQEIFENKFPFEIKKMADFHDILNQLQKMLNIHGLIPVEQARLYQVIQERWTMENAVADIILKHVEDIEFIRKRAEVKTNQIIQTYDPDTHDCNKTLAKLTQALKQYCKKTDENTLAACLSNSLSIKATPIFSNHNLVKVHNSLKQDVLPIGLGSYNTIEYRSHLIRAFFSDNVFDLEKYLQYSGKDKKDIEKESWFQFYALRECIKQQAGKVYYRFKNILKQFCEKIEQQAKQKKQRGKKYADPRSSSGIIKLLGLSDTPANLKLAQLLNHFYQSLPKNPHDLKQLSAIESKPIEVGFNIYGFHLEIEEDDIHIEKIVLANSILDNKNLEYYKTSEKLKKTVRQQSQNKRMTKNQIREKAELEKALSNTPDSRKQEVIASQKKMADQDNNLYERLKSAGIKNKHNITCHMPLWASV